MERKGKLARKVTRSLVESTQTQRLFDEGCVISNCLKWVTLPLNDVGRIIQHVRNGKEGKGWDGLTA